MVSITLSVPDNVKSEMERFSEINWSGFIRKQIITKTKELSWKEKMLKKLKQEQEITDWALDLQKKARKDRAKELQRKELL
jgi:hypothetical protein